MIQMHLYRVNKVKVNHNRVPDDVYYGYSPFPIELGRQFRIMNYPHTNPYGKNYAAIYYGRSMQTSNVLKIENPYEGVYILHTESKSIYAVEYMGEYEGDEDEI